MELPPATLVLRASQLPGKVKSVEDCNTIELPGVTPVALNWKFPPMNTGAPNVIGLVAACTVIVIEFVAAASL